MYHQKKGEKISANLTLTQYTYLTYSFHCILIEISLIYHFCESIEKKM